MIRKIFFVALLVNASLLTLRAQVIKGPHCVFTNTLYQYDIENTGKDSAIGKICISGGQIMGSSTNCLENLNHTSFIRVKWYKVGPGAIQLSGSKNVSFAVTISEEMNPGSIINTSKMQTVDQGTLPASIKCSEASGGNCNPVYTYQWQLSTDALRWTNISGEVNANLKFSSPVNEQTFYRRSVTEKNSGTIKYSDVAVVVVTIKQPNK